MFSSTISYLKQIRKARPTENSVVYHLTRKEKMRLALTVFSGKIFGVIAVVIFIKSLPGIFATTAFATETFTPHEITTFNSINTVWTLVAAFLVFGMQAGFVMLEAGFARSKETVNVLLECIFDTAICGILFWAIGYAFMFSHGNGFIGTHWFFLSGAPATYETTGIPILAHWIFQFAFADTTSTITSGAMIGRTSFRGDILYSIGVTGFIYPIIGHWAWGPDGWLALMGSEGHFFPSLGQGFRDFAGSTVVHTIGGVISLAGALVLGPRIGRIFTRDDKEKGGLPPAHNLPLATVGAFILWFGWYGFNPGSTLSAIDADGIGRIAANTTLAACAASLTAMILPLWFGPNKGKFDLAFTVNGLLAGLVAITCPCYWVSPFGAILIGLIAGVVVYYGTLLLEFLRIDDPVGAVPVHGIAGIWGTLSLGLFACGQFGATGPTGADNSSPVKGLFYGGGLNVLKAQFIGSAVITLSTFLIALILMWVVNKLPYPWKLRVEPEAEYGDGLDKFEHGVSAYHFQE
ncbi:MAG: ammonium transporter [Hydrotalea flava]|uniref:ammonium transporter n=1 Tax=Hydrotalea TaxID=1004300 RepID=UPI0009C095AB|nr:MULTISPECIES: ammonium transporter [Hydrotalea]NIM36642.1 ammonium transporter [Hydrotalea flava]NIM39502.1 ammonium transporter [Hydrotalea flava]NIN04691.1 ammonium transporter [Hydrotalea flava]NIN16363.1 ammonium transporter [Hydrotalea flava]NIO95428.1 ammonium transporter [Hydrotalea flava]